MSCFTVSLAADLLTVKYLGIREIQALLKNLLGLQRRRRSASTETVSMAKVCGHSAPIDNDLVRVRRVARWDVTDNRLMFLVRAGGRKAA